MIQRSRTPLRVLATMIFALLISSGAAPGAHAHPLGNFSLNRHDGLRLSPGHIEDTAVVDSAEIPTAQDREKTDTDNDGDVSQAEAATRARQRCSRLAEASRVTVNSRRSEWRVRSSRLTYGKAQPDCRSPGSPVASTPGSISHGRQQSRSPRVRTGVVPAGRRSPPRPETGCG